MMDKTIVILFAFLSAIDLVLGQGAQSTCTRLGYECQNGGTCAKINDVYNCWCSDGWGGALCDKDPSTRCNPLKVSGAGQLDGNYYNTSLESCNYQPTYGRFDDDGYIFFKFDWSMNSVGTWYIGAQPCQPSSITATVDASNNFPEDLSWSGGVSVTC